MAQELPILNVKDMMKLLRKNNFYPTTIRDQIFSEFPLTPTEEIEYKVEQYIAVHDPRLVLSEDPYFHERNTTVQIWREQRQVPVDETKIKTLYRIIPTKKIELLKEYSFEEWDNGLVWQKN